MIAAAKLMVTNRKVTGPSAVIAEQILQINRDINDVSSSEKHIK